MSEYIIKGADWAIDCNGDSLFKDAEEIVRCRDCVYNAKDTDGICYRFYHEHFNQPDGFCAWGKRK